jgi:hypothetical protein
MNVFTACSFQDLTGQRTTKVINALRYIEQRVAALIALWGLSEADAGNPPPGPQDTRPDGHLLHGPSLDGIDQGGVDRLMAGAPAQARAGTGPDEGPGKEREGEREGGPDERPPGLDQSAIDSLFG